MRQNTLKTLKNQGQTAANAWISLGSPYAAEILGHSGYDAVTVDLQHGMFGFDAAVQLLQAISSTPAIPLARPASNDLAQINKLLDAGAYGIISPLIETVDQAATLARACRYPPRGLRSFGPSRGLTYGGADYVDHADDTVMSLAMIETVPALDDIERILAVEELDGIYFGPSDLGLAMGLGPNAWNQPAMQQAVRHALEATQRAGKYAGIFAGGPEMTAEVTRMGYHLVTPGNDAAQLRLGAAQRLKEVRGAR
ncbi:HpcH/HpaI aldolase family protein [Amphibiibacter pelophylacis]|uniref:Aldolase/citrate lyase family protein n=1 Tax=Amphibiibacter pelophylacis TaxID=1799477 RepID=A0ACC6P3L0_9BURK